MFTGLNEKPGVGDLVEFQGKLGRITDKQNLFPEFEGKKIDKSEDPHYVIVDYEGTRITKNWVSWTSLNDPSNEETEQDIL
ncbi:MAG: hypothetical protein KAT32_01665 [Candidatus Moranbacteria bacterium]|nr:hypothetical protein [Candidatus Moranbacteria bacterium]